MREKIKGQQSNALLDVTKFVNLRQDVTNQSTENGVTLVALEVRTFKHANLTGRGTP